MKRGSEENPIEDNKAISSPMLLESEKYVDEAFGKRLPHFERTVFWVRELKPDADEALQISAYGHDIERAFRKKEDDGAFRLDPDALERHQKQGGQLMHDFLLGIGADGALAAKVQELIGAHEIGGTEEQDVLMDADSVSYFECNAKLHAGWTDKHTKDDIRKKFDRMFQRIKSDEARKVAQPMYEEILELLK